MKFTYTGRSTRTIEAPDAMTAAEELAPRLARDLLATAKDWDLVQYNCGSTWTEFELTVHKRRGAPIEPTVFRLEHVAGTAPVDYSRGWQHSKLAEFPEFIKCGGL